MAMTWKYPIPLVDDFVIYMPQGAEILFVATQNEQGCLWARVAQERGVEARKFLLRGTGHPVDMDCEHVGSFMLSGGALVFHLFELRTVEAK